MPQVSCLSCAIKFHAKPSWLKIGSGKYCSKQCHYKGLKKGQTVPCSICKKLTYRSPKMLSKSRSKKYFCSKSCQTRWRNTFYIGPRHINWKHGKTVYRALISRSGIQKVCKLCNSNDTRILAVHHIDRDRKNNTLKNLAWLCHNCHFLVHHYPTEKEKFMVSIA